VPSLLALFPLEIVLFPGTALPLHIFEPRYREMVGECLEQKLPFGVVRAKDGAVAEIGCTAEIVEVTKRYEDGRFDIVAEGNRRFEIVTTNSQRAFLRGEVNYIDDEPAPAARDQLEQLLQLHADILKIFDEDMPEVDQEAPLSFQLAATLPLDLDFKQKLLETRAESERVSALIKYYTNLLPTIRRAVKARRRAGGNGHVS
jgi:Lon protease-like protein